MQAFFSILFCGTLLGAPRTVVASSPNGHSYPMKIKLSPTEEGVGPLFSVQLLNDSVYFEIPITLLGKDLLLVNRTAKGGAGSSSSVYPYVLFAGDLNKETVIRFELGHGHRIWMRKVMHTTYAGDSTAPLYNAVIRSEVMPVIASFPIANRGGDTSLIRINVTELVLGDNDLFGPSPEQKAKFLLGAVDPGKSYISNIHGFARNIEIATFKTFQRPSTYHDVPSGGTSSEPGFYSLELNTSIVLLPDHPMRQRLADGRVGYFSIDQTDYDGSSDGVGHRDYIRRWRLEPSDTAAYNRGELVKPKKPIVFYIDPATPKKWVPYLIKGVNAWEKAFEQAGFRDAIYAREAPSRGEDSTWSLDDAEHSAIVYKPSTYENALGYSISDPRSGEILESHIDFHHNIVKLLHDWYMLQCAAVDPKARTMAFDDTLMGKLIEQVITHEVGHALGLAHNMGASSTVPTDSLRSRAWVDKNGLCPSIMDYARYDYVAQPGDGFTEDELINRLGVYDKWAIEWGYRVFMQYRSADEEKNDLERWVSTKLADPCLWFGEELAHGDPRRQREDLGDDAVKASTYGIANLRYFMKHIIEWSAKDGQGYKDLGYMYNHLQDQFYTYLSHVTKYIDGEFETRKEPGQAGPVYMAPNRAVQRRAVDFLATQFFNTPAWLLDTAVFNRTGTTGLTVLGDLDLQVVVDLTFPPRSFILEDLFARVQADFGVTGQYTAGEFLGDMNRTMWKELYTHTSIDIYRQQLQIEYLKHMIQKYKSYYAGYGAVGFIGFPYTGALTLHANELSAILYAYLQRLKDDISACIPLEKDLATRTHLEYLKSWVAEALTSKPTGPEDSGR